MFFGESRTVYYLTGLRTHVLGESRVAVYYLTGLRSHVFGESRMAVYYLTVLRPHVGCLLFNRPTVRAVWLFII